MTYEITMTVERNDIEQEVTVGLRYHKAFRVDRDSPPENAEFEIVSVKDENGKDFDLTRFEDEEAIEKAWDEVEFE